MDERAFQSDDGTEIVEGDIKVLKPSVLGTAKGVLHSVVIKNAKWPGGRFVYAFNNEKSTSLPRYMREIVQTAMTIWERSTPVTFAAMCPGDTHFVEYRVTDTLCSYSWVGRVEVTTHSQFPKMTKQEVCLRLDASIGEVLHEIGHALGLFHAHTRNDRDQYVTISSSDDNYAIQPGSYDVLGYDHQSIMHYPQSKEMKTHGEQSVGQNCYLSHGDIAAVTHIYGTGTETEAERLLFPQLTAVRRFSGHAAVEVFAQAVDGDIRRAIFTVTECNVESIGISHRLCSGLSSTVVDDSIQLYALENANTIIKIQEKGGNWETEAYQKVQGAIVGNVIPADTIENGQTVLFAQQAAGSVIEIRGKNINYYPIPLSIKRSLNGSQLTVVANIITTNRYDVFAIGTSQTYDASTHVLHLAIKAGGYSWEDLEAPPGDIGRGKIAGGLFGSSCEFGRIDLFAFGGNDHIIRAKYSEGNSLEWQDCGVVMSVIAGQWLAVDPVEGVGYDIFATNRKGEIQCFKFDATTNEFNTSVGMKTISSHNSARTDG